MSTSPQPMLGFHSEPPPEPAAPLPTLPATRPKDARKIKWQRVRAGFIEADSRKRTTDDRNRDRTAMKTTGGDAERERTRRQPHADGPPSKESRHRRRGSSRSASSGSEHKAHRDRKRERSDDRESRAAKDPPHRPAKATTQSDEGPPGQRGPSSSVPPAGPAVQSTSQPTSQPPRQPSPLPSPPPLTGSVPPTATTTPSPPPNSPPPTSLFARQTEPGPHSPADAPGSDDGGKEGGTRDSNPSSANNSQGNNASGSGRNYMWWNGWPGQVAQWNGLPVPSGYPWPWAALRQQQASMQGYFMNQGDSPSGLPPNPSNSPPMGDKAPPPGDVPLPPAPPPDLPHPPFPLPQMLLDPSSSAAPPPFLDPPQLSSPPPDTDRPKPEGTLPPHTLPVPIPPPTVHPIQPDGRSKEGEGKASGGNSPPPAPPTSPSPQPPSEGQEEEEEDEEEEEEEEDEEEEDEAGVVVVQCCDCGTVFDGPVGSVVVCPQCGGGCELPAPETAEVDPTAAVCIMQCGACAAVFEGRVGATVTCSGCGASCRVPTALKPQGREGNVARGRCIPLGFTVNVPRNMNAPSPSPSSIAAPLPPECVLCSRVLTSPPPSPTRRNPAADRKRAPPPPPPHGAPPPPPAVPVDFQNELWKSLQRRRHILAAWGIDPEVEEPHVSALHCTDEDSSSEPETVPSTPTEPHTIVPDVESLKKALATPIEVSSPSFLLRQPDDRGHARASPQSRRQVAVSADSDSPRRAAVQTAQAKQAKQPTSTPSTQSSPQASSPMAGQLVRTRRSSPPRQSTLTVGKRVKGLTSISFKSGSPTIAAGWLAVVLRARGKLPQSVTVRADDGRVFAIDQKQIREVSMPLCPPLFPSMRVQMTAPVPLNGGKIIPAGKEATVIRVPGSRPAYVATVRTDEGLKFGALPWQLTVVDDQQRTESPPPSKKRKQPQERKQRSKQDAQQVRNSLHVGSRVRFVSSIRLRKGVTVSKGQTAVVIKTTGSKPEYVATVRTPDRVVFGVAAHQIEIEKSTPSPPPTEPAASSPTAVPPTTPIARAARPQKRSHRPNDPPPPRQDTPPPAYPASGLCRRGHRMAWVHSGSMWELEQSGFEYHSCDFCSKASFKGWLLRCRLCNVDLCGPNCPGKNHGQRPRRPWTLPIEDQDEGIDLSVLNRFASQQDALAYLTKARQKAEVERLRLEEELMAAWREGGKDNDSETSAESLPTLSAAEGSLLSVVDKLGTLDYRTLQTLCKECGMMASGKSNDLRARLLEYGLKLRQEIKRKRGLDQAESPPVPAMPLTPTAESSSPSFSKEASPPAESTGVKRSTPQPKVVRGRAQQKGKDTADAKKRKRRVVSAPPTSTASNSASPATPTQPSPPPM